MTVKQIAKKIVNDDMGARKQNDFILKCYKSGKYQMTLEYFTWLVSTEVCNLLGIDN